MQVVAEQDTDQQRPPGVELPHTVRQRDLTELRQLEDRYRAGRPPERVNGRLVIVVGDGLVSLAVIRDAAFAVHRHRPARLVVALPTGTTRMCRELGRVADEVICPMSAGLLIPDVDDVRRLLSA